MGFVQMILGALTAFAKAFKALFDFKTRQEEKKDAAAKATEDRIENAANSDNAEDFFTGFH